MDEGSERTALTGAVGRCVARLVSRRMPGAPDAARGSDGVVVDLACCDTEMAAVISSLGLAYLGVTTDAALAERLAARGAASMAGSSSSDLTDDRLAPVLAGRRVVAVLASDELSRAADVDAFLGSLHARCVHLGAAPLVVRVANITHLDVVTDLVLGRWDAAHTGVPSSRHVRQFSERSLHAVMTSRGWEQVDAEDLVRGASPQAGHRPTVAKERSTPVGAQIAMLREMAAPAAAVEHFVRAYVPVEVPPANGDDLDAAGPFLSVLVRTQGRRDATLQEALLCLAAQTCDDFEVLVLLHDGEPSAAKSIGDLVAEFHPSFATRVRIIEVAGGGRCRPLNVGASLARGHYLAMLDDDDLILAHWVESFRAGADRSPAHVVRVAVAKQRVASQPGSWNGEDGYDVVDRPRLDVPVVFDHFDHMPDNRTPNNGYAVPRSVFADHGRGWDESLPVLEDWDHLLWAASLCGVDAMPTVAGLLRWWDVGPDSKSEHPVAVWEATRRRIVEAHDAVPLLLDRGAFSALRDRLIDHEVLRARAAQLEGDVQDLHEKMASAERALADARAMSASTAAQLDAVLHSHSWRLTAALRRGVGLGRRIARRARR